MRFTVSGTWHQQQVEIMCDDGFVQGPRDLLLELHLRAMLDAAPEEAVQPIPPMVLLSYLSDTLDGVDGIWADDGHPMLAIGGHTGIAVSHQS